MTDIDIHAMIERVDFPPAVWEYLDLLEEVLIATQEVIGPYDEHFIADTDFKKLLVMSINRDITTLNTI